MFDHIYGNEHIKAYLKRAIDTSHPLQTLLFLGPDGVGKMLFAKAFAEKLVGLKSPDIHFLAPAGKSGLYSIDAIRQMIEESQKAAFQSEKKAFILEDADRMLPTSQNALLKTLEEPAENTTFILITSRGKDLLPTIVSRCTSLHFHPLNLGDLHAILQDKGLFTKYAKLAQGSAAIAIEMVQNPDFETYKKILTEIISKNFSYPDLHAKIMQLEKMVLEKKEEDPIFAFKQIEHIFSLIFMIIRDQHAKKLGLKEDLLFFQDIPDFNGFELEKMEGLIERAQLGISRNMKLSTVLIEVFLTMQAWSEESKNTRVYEERPV